MKGNVKIRAAIVILIISMVIIPQAITATSIKQSIQRMDPLQTERQQHSSQQVTHQIQSEKLSKTVDLSKVNQRRLLIKVDQDSSFNTKEFGLKKIPLSHRMEKKGYQLVEVPQERGYTATQAELLQTSGILSAEPDYKRELSYVPNDPYYKEQWYLNQIDMPQAWDVTKGSSDVTIAVLDTGINQSHPDLEGRILPGYDFVDDDDDPNDDHGHGTHIAGMIASNANRIGVVGIDMNAKVLPVKIADSKGEASVTDVVDGVYYAIEQGADIINMSFGTNEYSESEDEALWEAYNEGMVLIAAAGNENTTELTYPAAYTPVIAVAASDQGNARSTFSNYGNTTDISAPGQDILSTHYEEGYAYQSGTSFAAPIVSAVAGLLRAEFPDRSPEQIEWALEYSAVKRSEDFWTAEDGYGVVNAINALQASLPSMEDDAGDFQSEAKVVRIGDTTQEKMELPMDVDWFQFKVDQRAEVLIELENVPSHLDLTAILYHYVNKKQISELEIDENDIGQAERYRFTAEPGNYYLAVYDIFNHWSETPYDVTIEKEDEPVFPDVENYVAEIEYLTEKEIIKGYPDGTFRPKNKITRVQAVHMILNEMGIHVEGSTAPDPGFSDVDEESYGYKAIATAVELGFISGKGDNTFDPGGDLTRGQMAAILMTAYDLEGDQTTNFQDIPEDHWAFEAVDALVTNEISNGYPNNTFKPNESISREHFSIFLFNYLTNG